MNVRKLTSAKVIKVYIEIFLVLGGIGAIVGTLYLLVGPAYVGEHGGDLAVTVSIGSPGIPSVLPLESETPTPNADPSFLRARLVGGHGELRAETKVWSLYFLSTLRLLIALAVFLWLAWILRAFLRTVLAGEPFHAANSRRLRTIGLVLVGLTLVGPVAEYLFARAVLAHLAVDNLALSPSLQFPKEVFFAGLVFLVFASVFRYGTELEDERSLTV